MTFEDRYEQRVKTLLIDRKSLFDLALRELMNNAAAKHTLRDGDTIRHITRCCSSQTEQSIQSLVSAATQIIDVYNLEIFRDDAWNIVERYIDDVIELSEKKKIEKLQIAQGGQNSKLNERHIVAASLTDKYQLFKDNAEFEFDKGLAEALTTRDTLKVRGMKWLDNNPIYLIALVIVVLISWLSNLLPE